MNAKASLYDTMYLFHLYNFQVRAVLCDAPSTNLCAIKLFTVFGRGAFGTHALGSCEDVHAVKTFFSESF